MLPTKSYILLLAFVKNFAKDARVEAVLDQS
jgi:hypothetical protein